jgi:hypothetical protein
VQGSNKKPEVIINPLSLVAPGIFRDIFQMTSPNPKVQVREDEAPPPAGKRTRSSSATAQGQSGDASGNEASIDGWSSSDSTDPNKKKR